MKKLFLALLVATFSMGLVACGATLEDETRIALITDYGDIDDESFNQGTWEGILAYSEEHDIEIQYFRPAAVSDADYIDSINLAVEQGYNIIVTPGFLFEYAVYVSQYEHPDVNFILLDAEPVGDDGEVDVADNTLSIYYNENESGFLAGYAAVKEGMRDLGFMGGIAVPAVRSFGIGFIAGAFYAADELGVTISFPDNRYDYLDTFDPDPEIESQASGWFSGGTDVIFAAAGGAGRSVMNAAEDSDAWMIGVDVDQHTRSERVLTSAMKALGASVQQAFDAYFDDDFPGGETWYLGAADDGVALPMENSRFENFTSEDYEAIFNLIADGTVVVPDSYSDLETFFDDLGISDLLVIERDTVE